MKAEAGIFGRRAPATSRLRKGDFYSMNKPGMPLAASTESSFDISTKKLPRALPTSLSPHLLISLEPGQNSFVRYSLSLLLAVWFVIITHLHKGWFMQDENLTFTLLKNIKNRRPDAGAPER